MSDLWFFTHAGLTCGPVPAGKLDELIAKGLLRDEEQVWLEGIDVQISVQSYRDVNRGGSLPTLVGALRQSGPPRVSPAPDWLADVRAAERLAASSPTIPLRGQDGLTSLPPDWLEDIRQIEQSRPRPAPAPAKPSSARATGFDADTGMILDAIVFIQWQREQQRQRQEELARQPAVAIGEAFLAARRVMQGWVDSEATKPLILSGNLDAVRRALTMQGVLDAYRGYGPVMQEKLMKHLEFLVENRRKFYRDFGDASQRRH